VKIDAANIGVGLYQHDVNQAALKKSTKAYESAVKQLKHLETSTKEKVGELEEKVDELAELGKEAVHDTKGHLIKAVTSAVNAFK